MVYSYFSLTLHVLRFHLTTGVTFYKYCWLTSRSTVQKQKLTRFTINKEHINKVSRILGWKRLVLNSKPSWGFWHRNYAFVDVSLILLDPLHMLVNSRPTARVIRRVWAGEGLARRHWWAVLSGIPHRTGVPPTWSCADCVVEAVRLAWEIVAAGSGKK